MCVKVFYSLQFMCVCAVYTIIITFFILVFSFSRNESNKYNKIANVSADTRHSKIKIDKHISTKVEPIELIHMIN